ncbi:MAG TPA: NHL repeat-containing protein [Candidatus Methylacidiphilales bacterium]|nr:NHL repeat-containing protein [Candidatus Methylacidiphilales bacterium]
MTQSPAQNSGNTGANPAAPVSGAATAPVPNNSGPKKGDLAQLSLPNAIAIDGHDNIYVADTDGHIIRKITPDGMVKTLAGVPYNAGFSDGMGSQARFNYPYGIAVSRDGTVYVADTNNQVIRKITPDGMVKTIAGRLGIKGGSDGPGHSASFNRPFGLAVDDHGNVYVADASNCAIRKITPDGTVTTFAGKASETKKPNAGSTDGKGDAARFAYPSSLATDHQGNIYVVDTNNYLVRKITPDGVVTTLAGNKGKFGSSDGKGAAAEFNCAIGIAVDDSGNLYVGDAGNYLVRKITPDGTVTTLAGAHRPGYIDAKGKAAQFKRPAGMAVDSKGNVYVADAFNFVIRKITPDGTVTTIAGVPHDSGTRDGKAW